VRGKSEKMAYGYHEKILHVNLTTGILEIEHPSSDFYRKYLGGSAMGLYYLLQNTPPNADPLGSENTLCLMVGVLAGSPLPGQSRVTATAKSPQSGLVGDSQSGGFWPAELKAAGFDGIVIHGRSPRPVYLWVHDGQAELRKASSLWGGYALQVEETICQELGDGRVQILQCGPAAEKGVLFGALLSNANRANGRTGMGTVMASKNLKAVVVRGHNKPVIYDREGLQSLTKWATVNFPESDVVGLGLEGTQGGVIPQDSDGGFPTRNWESGTFEGAQAISGQALHERMFKRRDTCYSCVVRCKQVVELNEGPFQANPRYGGPEYETISTFGSYCGVSDLAAVAHANQICNMYGMDTISCGAVIAWAMDCFARGLLTMNDTDGLDLCFGNAEAMVEMTRRIGERQGLGRILGEGSARAAEALGVGKELVVAIKNIELPAHMPQVKGSLALIYSVNPFGADHCSSEHDPSYNIYKEKMADLGLVDPQPSNVLNAEKVNFALRTQIVYSLLDSLCVCQFVFGPSFQLFNMSQLTEAVQAVTGWDVTLDELLEVGERRLNLLRAFNAREGVGSEADTLPQKLLIPLKGGASNGMAVDLNEWQEARTLYYQMAGWDSNGFPTRQKLETLGLDWITRDLGT